MAVTLTTPQFSFIQFGIESAPNCGDDPTLCLPVESLDSTNYDNQDIIFQFLLNATNPDLTNLVNGINDPGSDGSADIIFMLSAPSGTDLPCGDIVGSPNQPHFKAKLLNLTGPPAYPIAGYQFLGLSNLTAYGTTLFAEFAYGACFNITAMMRTYTTGGDFTTTILGCSTRYIKAKPSCYTSWFGVNNNSNAFGYYFNYLNSFLSYSYYDAVRLPVYLHSPVQVEEEDSYEKSDGSTVLNSYRVWKDYKFKTDYWPENWHENFAFLTALDTVLIQNEYAGLVGVGPNDDVQSIAFVRKEKIELQWWEEDMPFFQRAMGKGVLRLAIPRTNVNSNCTT